MHLNKDTLDHKAPNPELLAKAHSLMEWSNVLVIACAALGITAWFTSHVTMFYVLGSSGGRYSSAFLIVEKRHL